MGNRKYFGTDGIRGRANVFPMTGEVAFLLGRAVTHYFLNIKKGLKQKKPLIILGKDTRLSCYMLEQAFSAGVCAQGGEVILTGPLPTPGVAFVTKSMSVAAISSISPMNVWLATLQNLSLSTACALKDSNEKMIDMAKVFKGLMISPRL